MEKPDKDGHRYILTIPYETDEELDRIIYDDILWQAAALPIRAMALSRRMLFRWMTRSGRGRACCEGMGLSEYHACLYKRGLWGFPVAATSGLLQGVRQRVPAVLPSSEHPFPFCAR